MTSISDQEFLAAQQRMKELLDSTPTATAARFDVAGGSLVVDLSNGERLEFVRSELSWLQAADEKDLVDIEISPVGLGIHFPKVDVDLYVPSLIEQKRNSLGGK